MLNDGRYTLVYPDGQYRTLQVKTPKQHSKLASRQILSIKEGRHFNGAGFLTPAGKINFWQRVRSVTPLERLVRIQRAVDRVVADPEAAGLAYAMKENRCYRCGKELTVPASIHKGMGPECAKKNWTRKDQQAAYQARSQEPKRSVGTEPSKQMDFNERWAEHKNEHARREIEQDQAAEEAKLRREEFENQLCLICRVPRYRCCC